MKSYGSVAVGGIGGAPPDLTVRPYDPARYADQLRLNTRAHERERQARQAYIDAQQGKGTRARPAPKPKAKRPTPTRTADPAAKDKHTRWRAMYEAGMSTTRIAQTEGVPQSTVVSGIHSAGGTTRRREGRTPNPINVAAAVAEYEAGDSLRTLARRHRTTDDRIRSTLILAGVHIRDIGHTRLANPQWRDPAFVARVNSILDGGGSQAATARAVGVSAQQVQRHVARRKATP